MDLKLTGFVAVSESGAKLYVLTDDPKKWFVDNIVKHHMTIDNKWQSAKISISIKESQ